MVATASLTDLYMQVQHFYAHQMQALDDRRFEQYAATFTPDGYFQHSPYTEPSRTRPAIHDMLIEFHKKFDDDPVQRRHWFNHIALEPQDDGSIKSTVYALVIESRPGVREPQIAPSCVVHDVLVVEDGEVYTRSRVVTQDFLF
jgi:actinorhodin biosynthesis protein ActVIA